jgi:hypothetical protein
MYILKFLYLLFVVLNSTIIDCISMLPLFTSLTFLFLLVLAVQSL